MELLISSMKYFVANAFCLYGFSAFFSSRMTEEIDLERDKILRIFATLKKSILNLSKPELQHYYKYFYDNVIGNVELLKMVYEILAESLKNSFKSKDELEQLAAILQYPRRHFQDIGLNDPFVYYKLSSLDPDSHTMDMTFNLKTDCQ